MCKATIKIYPIIIVTLCLMAGVLFLNPLCHAGGALTLIPADDRVVPEGTHIPERRIKNIEKKVKAFKSKMKTKDVNQQQEQQPQNESPITKAPKE